MIVAVGWGRESRVEIQESGEYNVNFGMIFILALNSKFLTLLITLVMFLQVS